MTLSSWGSEDLRLSADLSTKDPGICLRTSKDVGVPHLWCSLPKVGFHKPPLVDEQMFRYNNRATRRRPRKWLRPLQDCDIPSTQSPSYLQRSNRQEWLATSRGDRGRGDANPVLAPARFLRLLSRGGLLSLPLYSFSPEPVKSRSQAA